MKNSIIILLIVMVGFSSCQVNRSFSKHRNLYHKSHSKEKIVDEEVLQPVEVVHDENVGEEVLNTETSITKTDEEKVDLKQEIKTEKEITLQVPINNNSKIKNELHIKREVKKVIQQEKKKAKSMAPAPGIRGEAKGHSVMRTVFVSVLLVALSFAIIAFLFNTFNPILVLCFAMLIYAMMMMQIHVGDFDISYGPEQSGYVNGQWVKYQQVTVTY